jgi:Carboxypeptidase regulatory-like domain
MCLRRPTLLFLLSILTLAGAAQSFAQSPADESTPQIGEITGRVLNDMGQPVPHALVFVSSQGQGIQRTAITDEAGNFVIPNLDISLYFVGASAPSYAPLLRDPNASDRTYRIGDTVTLNLLRGGVITGTVTTAAGEPLVQAVVRTTLIRDANGKVNTTMRFPMERMTDDRGVYRIYGLPAGTYVVSAGGRIAAYSFGAYDSDAPTYAPSSTRDTATEIEVKAGQETSGVDIRYRPEPGRAISGAATGQGSANAFANIALSQVVNGVSHLVAVSFQAQTSKGFAFYGLPDGEYDLAAQAPSAQGDSQGTEPLHVSVRGRDVSGLNLVLNTMPSLAGRVVLTASTAIECQNKRKPLFAETLLVARRSEKSAQKNSLTFPNFSTNQTSPDKKGDFAIRSIAPGQYSLSARFFAKYWYLRSIEREPATTAPAKAVGARANDLARNGFQAKFGDRLSKVTVTLAEGAASVKGAIKTGANATLPKLFVHLVPAEKENAEDVLRFFGSEVQPDGSFSLTNIPPGNYWVLARTGESSIDEKLRTPEEAETRLQIRREAETAKVQLELKPCQNVVDYRLTFKNSAPKN